MGNKIQGLDLVALHCPLHPIWSTPPWFLWESPPFWFESLIVGIPCDFIAVVLLLSLHTLSCEEGVHSHVSRGLSDDSPDISTRWWFPARSIIPTADHCFIYLLLSFLGCSSQWSWLYARVSVLTPRFTGTQGLISCIHVGFHRSCENHKTPLKFATISVHA